MIPNTIERILLIPETEPGQGIGHLMRTARIIESLKETNGTEAAGVYCLIPEKNRERVLHGGMAFLLSPGITPDTLWPESFKTGKNDLVVLDLRSPDPDMVETLVDSGATVLGLDTVGPARIHCSYLVDTLLTPLSSLVTHRPNRRGVFPVPVETARAGRRSTVAEGNAAAETRTAQFSPDRVPVLVSFGGEDPAGLTVPVVEALVSEPSFGIDVVIGPAAPAGTGAGLRSMGVRIREMSGRLERFLNEYQVVVTSFGITAFEAQAAGAAVVLVNPSGYHQDLSGNAGFMYHTLGPPDAEALVHTVWSALSDRGTSPVDDAVPPETALSGVGPARPAVCPVCGAVKRTAVDRFADRTYFRCARCGILYMTRFTEHGIAYDKAYFFEDYQKQYGRTYLDDLPRIRTLCKPRVRIIRDMIAGSGILNNRKKAALSGGAPRVLDIGCAYGAFLLEMAGAGADVTGLDTAEHAVTYVRDVLGMKALCGPVQTFLPEDLGGEGSYAAVTMWYVIEHFEDLSAVLSLVRTLLAPGGVFAFSTPHGSGVSSRRNRTRFLEKSPPDHYTVWERETAGQVLKRFGFALEKVRITGHHGDRFLDSRIAKKILSYPLGLYSRVMGLGDTFELYARKTENV
jgi:2-polyprenyl-3-methyl-5-hydroxy-6-metoxy-1,4-benzoquinol methylase